MTTEIQAGLEAAQKAEEYVRRAALVRQYEGNPDLEPNPAKRARAEDRAQFWEQQARGAGSRAFSAPAGNFKATDGIGGRP
jgi:hypothetical protein